MSANDTIAAIATAPGEGGLGVIRLSGPDAVGLASHFFRAANHRPLEEQDARKLVLGSWVDPRTEKFWDELLCVRFPAPHSFTGEDVVELHTHGGAFHMRAILATLLDRGARLAEAGEFTRRAFVNGRMDLTRAEAVADLILSGTEMSRAAAARQLAGGLFDVVESLRLQVVGLSAAVEAAVDFPEEEAQFLPREGLLEQVRSARKAMRALLETARSGRLLRQGLRLTLAGRPNAGKSSLMNALLGCDRSIVSEEPGTTRDYIEERFAIQGFPVVITDTAGLRGEGPALSRSEGVDAVESEGVRRSRARMFDADLIAMLLDPTEPLDLSGLLPSDASGADHLWVLSKGDLPASWDAAQLMGALRASGLNVAAADLCVVSARTGLGMDGLKERILFKALGGRSAQAMDGALLTQARHEDAMRRADQGLEHVEATLLQSDKSAEFLAGDLRDALDALGEIVGKTSREDVIHAIFSKFCIGK